MVVNMRVSEFTKRVSGGGQGAREYFQRTTLPRDFDTEQCVGKGVKDCSHYYNHSCTRSCDYASEKANWRQKTSTSV